MGESDYLFFAGNARMETTTITNNTISSQYGIGEGSEFWLGGFIGVTESYHNGDVDATLLNQVKPILLL